MKDIVLILSLAGNLLFLYHLYAHNKTAINADIATAKADIVTAANDVKAAAAEVKAKL
jgi:hypothetical protein